MTATEITQTGYSQGFRQFFKVVDWHISENTGHFFFCAARHLSSAEDGRKGEEGGVWGHTPPGNF